MPFSPDQEKQAVSRNGRFCPSFGVTENPITPYSSAVPTLHPCRLFGILDGAAPFLFREQTPRNELFGLSGNPRHQKRM